MSEFFAMGGYAPYVWGSYGLAFLVLLVLLVVSLLSLRRTEATLRTLEAGLPRRRRRRETAQEAGQDDAGLLAMTGGATAVQGPAGNGGGER